MEQKEGTEIFSVIGNLFLIKTPGHTKCENFSQNTDFLYAKGRSMCAVSLSLVLKKRSTFALCLSLLMKQTKYIRSMSESPYERDEVHSLYV